MPEPKPTFTVDPRACVFTLQALSVEHLFPGPDTVCEDGPIVVSRLSDGQWFVHNGRHRVIRELLTPAPAPLLAVDLY